MAGGVSVTLSVTFALPTAVLVFWSSDCTRPVGHETSMSQSLTQLDLCSLQHWTLFFTDLSEEKHQQATLSLQKSLP